MPQVMIQCPATGKDVYTGLNFAWSTLDWEPLGELSFTCSACGAAHTWTKDDAILRADGAGD